MLRVVDYPEIDPEELKASVDLRTVVTPDALIRADKPTRVLCPWHDDHEPSLFVYPDHAYCYSCRDGMDLYDYVAWQEGLRIPEDFGEVVALAAERYGGSHGLAHGLAAPPWAPPWTPRSAPVCSGRPVAPARASRPLPRSVAEYYHSRLGSRREWFQRRGLADWTIDRELVGYDRRAFAIPVWSKAGELLTVRFRRDDSIGISGSKYWGIAGRNGVMLYNESALEMVDVWRDSQVGPFVVICEGELDALRLSQEGAPAVSATNGAGAFSPAFVERVLAYGVDKVIVAYDMDQAGVIGGAKVAQMFRSRGVHGKWPPEWGKDVTEALLTVDVVTFLQALFDNRGEFPDAVDRYWARKMRAKKR